MKLKKIGGVAAAVTMLSLGSAALADHEASCAKGLSDMIKQSAAELACMDGATFDTLGYSGTWPPANPLWQHRAGKLKKQGASEEQLDAAGCEVHAKLATKLYAIRPDDGSPPRRNKKGSNDAQGAANSLDPLNLKFEAAVLQLEAFKEAVDASTPNPDSANFPALPGNDTPSQSDWETHLKLWADDMIYSVKVCGHLEL